jgi:hypothetical protein
VISRRGPGHLSYPNPERRLLIRIVPDPHPETLEDGLRQAFRNAAISDDSLDGPADAVGVAGIDVVQRVEIARTRTLDGVGEMCSFEFDDSTLAAYEPMW